MEERERMVCPDCGVAMNLHAEKVDYSADAPAGRAEDDDFGGLLTEFHTCPACGRTHARRAD